MRAGLIWTLMGFRAIPKQALSLGNVCNILPAMSVSGNENCAYIQVSVVEAASAAEAPAPAPVITFEAFQSLCLASPLQVILLK